MITQDIDFCIMVCFKSWTHCPVLIRHPPLGFSLGLCFFSCLLIGCCYFGSSEISISLLSASLNSLGLTLGGNYYEILISYDDILLSESSVVCQNATETQDIDFCIMICLNSWADKCILIYTPLLKPDKSVGCKGSSSWLVMNEGDGLTFCEWLS